MSRIADLASLALCLTGFAIGALMLRAVPWPFSAKLLSAVLCGVVIGPPECLLIRKLTEPGSRLFRLDGKLFPFASLGFCGSVVVFA
jgi:hypothetical protein